MKIQFKNIGLLKDIELDLSKRLILMCGPNNSGKTFASYCIYGLYQLINSRELTSVLLQAKNLKEINEKGNLNVDLSVLFRNAEKRISDHIARLFKRRLPDVFASSPELFSQSETKIFIDKGIIENKILAAKIDTVLKLGRNISVKISKEINETNVTIVVVEEKSNSNERDFPREFINHVIDERLLDFILKLIFENTYIAPAERTAINLFSKELSVTRNEIVDRLLQYKDGNKRQAVLSKAQRYPLPIKDSLAIAEDLATLQKSRSEFDHLAILIEKEILKGKIKISKEGEILFNPNRSKVKNLKIHISASIVKSLSNFVFYFRHLAKKGDFIIIDEPELNLHPDNQRIIARLLGTIINNGFKVMISTHSDYIIRELNNLIMLKSGGTKANSLITKYKYKKEELISHNEIGAYLFKTNGFSPIEITETGFEIATIDKEINSINESSQDIYFTLF